MKKNLPLIVGISLPIVFIIIMAIAIFVPAWSLHPRYSFLYSSDDMRYSYNQLYRSTYIVVDHHLAVTDLPNQEKATYTENLLPLYLYDMKTNTAHMISVAEAQKYVLDPGPSSPDGYTVSYEYGNSGIFELFGTDRNSSGYFIEKNGAQKRLDGMSMTDRYGSYSSDLKLIGWITN